MPYWLEWTWLSSVSQSSTVMGTESSLTPLTKAVGVPLTPLAVAYFQKARMLELVLYWS